VNNPLDPSGAPASTQPDTNGVLLEVRDLEVTYGDFQVLWGVSFSVRKGEIACLLGTNGSGKSTTLNAIAGMTRPQAGAIWFDGHQVDGWPMHRLVKHGLVLVPERRRIFPGLMVWENLWLGAWTKTDRKQRDEMLETVYNLFPVLKEKRNHPAGQLSGGQQQMVAIGRGLMARPRLLMLDEPYLGLNPAMAAAISDAILRINAAGVTVLLIDADVFRALNLSHRGFVMDAGHVVLSGSENELHRNEALVKVYLGEALPEREST
jgi:branched-chain amino acid transport system ATP-binding protein